MWNNPQEMGEIAPFSSSTIASMLKEVHEVWLSRKGKKMRILEVGAGEGGITRALSDFAQENEGVDVTIVELNPAFCKELNDIPKVTVNCPVDIIKFKSQDRFDVVISTIPEQNLKATMLGKIYDALTDLVNPHGSLIRVRYAVQWSHVWWLMSAQEKQWRKDTIRAYHAFEKWQEGKRWYETSEMRIYRNIPPTDVIIMRFD